MSPQGVKTDSGCFSMLLLAVLVWVWLTLTAVVCAVFISQKTVSKLLSAKANVTVSQGDATDENKRSEK